jgi:Fe2+ transport system protein FeoA
MVRRLPFGLFSKARSDARAGRTETVDSYENKPLSRARAGSRVTIDSFQCGRAVACRLISMGLARGDSIEVVTNDSPGAVTVGKNGSRLVIGRGLAGKIIVSGLKKRKV